MKKTIKSFILPLALILSLCLLVGCANVPELPVFKEDHASAAGTDGEIKGNAKENHAGDMILGSDDACADEEAAWDVPMESEASKDIVADSYMDGDMSGYGSNGFSQQAGQLTASEWNDLANWDDFKALVNQNNFYAIAQQWSVYATSRIKVDVTCDGALVKGAKVELLDAGGTLLWNAVTDHTGTAYTFYNVTDGKGTQSPHSVRVTAVNGATATVEVAQGKDEVKVALSGAANPEITLDLMLMVDTTGSMGDELEYLKAELGDVISRAAQNSNVSVRTSVNFYRDTTDDYIVRYYDFRDSVDEAVALLAQQSANGGGDYPEAVHTALNNAITGHAWSEHSVKLLFFVFDAPPHAEQDVMASLNDSIAKAAEMGIRIIPVASSGVDDTCQLLFRSYAALTGGTYTYLTNHSGIGGSHATPELPEEPGVERLNDMMVRIITEYCQ